MPIFRRKTTCYCMWSVFAVTREDADISRVVFYGDSVWFDKLGLLVCVCVAVSSWVCRSIVSRFVRLVRSTIDNKSSILLHPVGFRSSRV